MDFDLEKFEFKKFKTSIGFEDDALIFINNLGIYQYQVFLNFHYENKDLIELISHRKFDVEIEKMTDEEWLEWLNFDSLFKGREWLRFRQFNKGLKKYEKELIIEFYTLLNFYVKQMIRADIESESNRRRKGFLIYVKAYINEYKKLYKFFLDNKLLEI